MRNSRIYFIGDTHFSHFNIIKYCNRPFNSIEEMDEKLIKNWNSIINKNDIVYLVGDFALCGRDKIIEIGKKLKGKKRLILGNHDKASLETYQKAGFEYIYNHPIILEEKYIVSHIPMDYNGSDFINIFAHVHDSSDYKTITYKSFCVSAERIGFEPISFEEIKSQIRELKNGQ